MSISRMSREGDPQLSYSVKPKRIALKVAKLSVLPIGRKANESHFWRDGMPILKLVANARTKIYETKLYGDMTSPSKPRRCGAMEHSRPLPLRACN